jgi:hypothetical protein
LGWDTAETQTAIGLVWGHHTFKADPEQRYGVRPDETDPLFPAARALAIADMACAMAEGRKVRAYKDASPRDVIRSELHSGSSVDSDKIDHLLYGNAQPAKDTNNSPPNCEPGRRRRANIGRGVLIPQQARLNATA